MKIKKTASIIFIALFLITVFGLGAFVVLRTPGTVSESERRELAAKPQMTMKSVADGTFFTSFEDYLLDQFAWRDTFRRIKAVFQFGVLRQKENNGISVSHGQAFEIKSEMEEKPVNVYIKRINALADTYFSDGGYNLYSTVIPDKSMYLSEGAGIPCVDYGPIAERIKTETSAKFIDIYDLLDGNSYYATDSHWKQTEIVDVADRILTEMGANKIDGIRKNDALAPFYGVYYGHSALPLPSDEIVTLTYDTLDAVKVLRANKKTGVLEDARLYYDEYITADDAYDVFLGGACTVIVIENTCNPDGKTLYLFSDSFGRSLAPLLVSDYGRVVVFDIRYIKTSRALETVPPEQGSDILFAYSISAIEVSDNLQVK